MRYKTLLFLLLLTIQLTAQRFELPIAVWIDDDTNDTVSISKVKMICDEIGIKATFACITNRLEQSELGIKEKLMEYQLQGFSIVNHSTDHRKELWRSTSIEMIGEVEKDMVKSSLVLYNAGFLDANFFVFPFGKSSKELWPFIKRLTGKHFLAGISVSTPSNINLSTDSNCLQLARMPIVKYINPEITKKAIKEAYDKHAFLIFLTHSASKKEFDVKYVEDIMSYTESIGFKFMTMPEAWKHIKKQYER